MIPRMPRPSLILALSPYHLATREPPAMLALILGSRIVTLMPHPGGERGATREEVKAAVDASPRYLRLMESWRWSGPLWQTGVISSGLDGEELASELPAVYDDIDRAESLAPLRPLTRATIQRAAESPAKSLDFLAADVLKGGPDPGINIPISAALDRFASRHNLTVVRGFGGSGGSGGGGGATSNIAAPSLAQRAEARLATRIFSFAMPVLLRAGGGRIAVLRDDLSKPIDALRAAIASIAESARAGTPADDSKLKPHLESLTLAASNYAKSFTQWSDTGGASGDDENRERIVSGYVSVLGQTLPADAVLRAGRAALKAINPSAPDDPAPTPQPAPRIFTLTIREMNVRPEA